MPSLRSHHFCPLPNLAWHRFAAKNKWKNFKIHLLWSLKILAVVFCGCSFNYFNISDSSASGFCPMDVNSRGDVVGFSRNGVGKALGIVISHEGIVRFLNPLESGGMTQGFSINDRGDVVGVAELEGRCQPVLWTAQGVAINLVDQREGMALSINNKGEVVGSILVENEERAFYWKKDVGFCFLLSPNGFGQANSINDLGEIAGSVAMEDGLKKACVWKGKYEEPFVLFGIDSKDSTAVCINNKGHVVGLVDGGNSSFIWSELDGAVILDFKGEIAEAFYLNNDDQVVGSVTTADGSFCSFIWDSKNLGRVFRQEGTSSIAYCLTDDGEVIGYVWPFDEKQSMEERANSFLMKGHMFRKHFDEFITL